MGNFYTNYALPGVTQSTVAAALAGRPALVSPAVNNVVVVFDDQSDSQDTEVINALAVELSAKCKCPVLATMNHDDDVLWYGLFTDGELADECNSCPGYFDDSVESEGPSGGDAAKLAAFGRRDGLPYNPPMQWTEPAGRLLVVRESARRRHLLLPLLRARRLFAKRDTP